MDKSKRKRIVLWVTTFVVSTAFAWLMVTVNTIRGDGANSETIFKQPLPYWVLWLCIALMVLSSVPDVIKRINKRRNPEQARDDELAADDERGKAITAQANSLTLRAMRLVIIFGGGALMLFGEIVAAYVLLMSAYVIQLLNFIFTSSLKRKM
ncbi:MAG: hypothetical protein LBN30_00400 [Oscillospiraceae bacterium]|jgi:hypothetical protein|nr:hypothetical protein [Oscillospiraceae bacterium]